MQNTLLKADTTKPPIIFVSHGAPNTILQTQSPVYKFLVQLGQEILEFHKKHIIKGILMVSAHWETPEFTVSTHSNPELIYDFYGFEPEMYKMTYPAPTSSTLSKRVVELLKSKSIKILEDSDRYFDHGTWMPLKIMLPDANIPVVQLSMKDNFSPEEHLAVGKAIASLRDEGYLIIGSGGAVHNLRVPRTKLFDWAPEFEKWLDDVLLTKDSQKRAKEILDFEKQSSFSDAHPTDDHFIPAVVAVGAAGDLPAKKIHAGWTFGSLSMATYAFE